MSSGEHEVDESFVQYCTQCGQMLKLRASMAGKSLACPGCKAPVVVAGIAATPAENIPTLRPADSPRGTSPDDFDAPSPRRREREGQPQPGSKKVLWIVLGGVGAAALVGAILLLSGVMGDSKARSTSMNNLKQIGLAMHNYHESNNRFPPAAISDPQGRPLLSWRVALLPYIEQDHLYTQFRLNEPWDSPHNLPLLDRMPKLYADPKNPERSSTVYQVFVGEWAIFHPDARRSRRLTDIADGSSNTLLVVESSRSVPWTKPDDIPFAGGGLPPTMAPRWRGNYIGLFADGSVRELPAAMPPMKLNALITAAGGEAIDVFEDDRRRPRFP